MKKSSHYRIAPPEKSPPADCLPVEIRGRFLQVKCHPEETFLRGGYPIMGHQHGRSGELELELSMGHSSRAHFPCAGEAHVHTLSRFHSDIQLALSLI